MTSHPKATPKFSPAVHGYLIFFNILSALGWLYLLFLLTAHLISPLPTSLTSLLVRTSTSHLTLITPTTLVQSLATLEVIHVILGWVRSPLPTTAAQVASRLFLVWGVLARYPDVRTSPILSSMILSWSITEVIRYSFYALSLMSIPSQTLLWLRYTTFYVLYPTGASSEAFLIFATLPKWGTWGWQDFVYAGLFAMWWPGLYIMYTYMIKQRRKVFGRGASKGAKAN